VTLSIVGRSTPTCTDIHVNGVSKLHKTAKLLSDSVAQTSSCDVYEASLQDNSLVGDIVR